jgi:hypothetical protein
MPKSSEKPELVLVSLSDSKSPIKKTQHVKVEKREDITISPPDHQARSSPILVPFSMSGDYETFDQWLAGECLNRKIPLARANMIKTYAVRLANQLIDQYSEMDDSENYDAILAKINKPDNQLVSGNTLISLLDLVSPH